MTAADRLRALAEAATPGPWRVILPGDPSWSERRKYRCVDAALSPDVVLALADLLDAAARMRDADIIVPPADWPISQAFAAAVAHVEEVLDE